jgi:hypothetical protein
VRRRIGSPRLLSSFDSSNSLTFAVVLVAARKKVGLEAVAVGSEKRPFSTFMLTP